MKFLRLSYESQLHFTDTEDTKLFFVLHFQQHFGNKREKSKCILRQH